jgi:TRAP-type transport system small permease protein
LAQTKISWEVEAPVTGWSMAWLPIACIVFAISAAVFHVQKLVKLATGKLRDDELVTVQESEDLAHIQHEAERKGDTK